MCCKIVALDDTLGIIKYLYMKTFRLKDIKEFEPKCIFYCIDKGTVDEHLHFKLSDYIYNIDDIDYICSISGDYNLNKREIYNEHVSISKHIIFDEYEFIDDFYFAEFLKDGFIMDMVIPEIDNYLHNKNL